MMVRPAWMHLYRSDDGGRSYSLALQLDSPVGDFWIDRIGSGDVYVLNGKTLWHSADQGQSWSPLGSLPGADPNEVVLTASEAGGPTFYAAARQNGEWRLYRSSLKDGTSSR